MNIDPVSGLPIEADALKEIAKEKQKINILTVSRRYGKIITIISGFDAGLDINETAKVLKEKLACGGTVKNGVIELQGNHVKNAKKILVSMGFSEDSINT